MGMRVIDCEMTVMSLESEGECRQKYFTEIPSLGSLRDVGHVQRRNTFFKIKMMESCKCTSKKYISISI